MALMASITRRKFPVRTLDSPMRASVSCRRLHRPATSTPPASSRPPTGLVDRLALKGMRTYQGPDEFVESFVGAQHEAADSCGTNALYSEKHISHPRHVEVQVAELPTSINLL